MITKEKKEFQTTVKMSISLKNNAQIAADELGISLMEYIRRAIQEKLDRDKAAPEGDEELRSIVRGIVEEMINEQKKDS